MSLPNNREWVRLQSGGTIQRVTTRVITIKYPNEEAVMLNREYLYASGALLDVGADTGSIVIDNAAAVRDGLATE